MAPIKQTVTRNGNPSRGKTNSIVRGIVPQPIVDQHDATEDTGAPPHLRAVATSVQLAPLFEGQILQMLADMDQQIRSDHGREQVALNRENAAHENTARE